MRNLLVSLTCSLTALSSPALAQTAEPSEPVSLETVAETINARMRAHHYDPAELDSAAYRAIETATIDLGRTAETPEDFLAAYNALWADGPFSHVQLSIARAPVAAMIAQIDSMRIGGGGAVLSWEGDTAILDINTMMGNDTIEEIEVAYSQIASRGADKLIIDLRGNSGGAFAVKPLVEHVIETPLDAGVFVSQPWNAAYDRAPTVADIADLEPWTGWSVSAFWASARNNMLTPIRFHPETEDHFSGPVFVLIDQGTQSAAEMAADALDASDRVTLVGESTPGRMLSQTIFDIPGGFQLALPIADYYSIANGRIEGHGVAPDIEMEPEAALEYALAQ
ncbi:S41 family peptidase [Maricaulis sp. D1M11]|uniref:S41 family peptidase n=1 Tax=Maricaulis sp. D1M11 TaxID=3076117 RepID=UPI0039B6242B